MWPFTKKLKISVAVVNTISQEQKLTEAKALAEKKAKLRESNKAVIQNIVFELLKREVDKFKYKHYQPYNIGDQVLMAVRKTGDSLGWVSNVSSFVNHFKDQDSRIGYYTVYKVDRIWVDTGWLANQLDLENNRHAETWLDIEDPIEIEYAILNYIGKLKSNYRPELVEWVVDFNWKELNFNPTKGSGKDFLDIKWNGFPANQFLLMGTDIAAKQLTYISLDHDYRELKRKTDKAYKELAEAAGDTIKYS